MTKKIVSGGQTGADQAGLDAAMRHNIPHGGWTPKGRLTENGPLPERYKLKEMASPNYAVRTEQNVIDSDGTLIIAHGKLTNGSALTRELAEQHNKPCLFLDMSQLSFEKAHIDLVRWLSEHHIEVLNIAGPRASKDPEISATVSQILDNLFSVE